MIQLAWSLCNFSLLPFLPMENSRALAFVVEADWYIGWPVSPQRYLWWYDCSLISKGLFLFFFLFAYWTWCRQLLEGNVEITGNDDIVFRAELLRLSSQLCLQLIWQSVRHSWADGSTESRCVFIRAWELVCKIHGCKVTQQRSFHGSFWSI